MSLGGYAALDTRSRFEKRREPRAHRLRRYCVGKVREIAAVDAEDIHESRVRHVVAIAPVFRLPRKT